MRKAAASCNGYGKALTVTDELKTTFIEQLAAAHGAVDPLEATDLLRALDDCYAAARDVSSRLIADETGEGMADAINAMQTKQARFTQTLKRTTAFDRRELTLAFAAALDAEASAKVYRFWITVGCLVSVIFLSTAMSRGVLRAMAEVTAGFNRFGNGDFGPIRVV